MADALTSWHDTAVKSAIVDFVARITTEGGTHYVRPPIASRRSTTTGPCGASSLCRCSFSSWPIASPTPLDDTLSVSVVVRIKQVSAILRQDKSSIIAAEVNGLDQPV